MRPVCRVALERLFLASAGFVVSLFVPSGQRENKLSSLLYKVWNELSTRNQEILSYLRGERIICSCAAMRDTTCVFDGGQKAGC